MPLSSHNLCADDHARGSSLCEDVVGRTLTSLADFRVSWTHIIVVLTHKTMVVSALRLNILAFLKLATGVRFRVKLATFIQ
jgi:hypothetical protein